jgi:FkbM family methyltransferase
LRRLAELVSRGIVLKRRLPSQYGGGLLYVSPDCGLKYYRKDLGKADPFLFQMAAELVRPGDVVWDIGANVGLFSFSAAGLSGSEGHVVAVEPDGWLVSLLRRSSSLREPSRSPVVVIPAAVSDSLSLANLHIASRGRSANFIDGAGVAEAGGTRRVDSVISVTLDWLLEHQPSPQVLKIDVEGMEHRVLAGATELLTKARPRIWCEVLPCNASATANILRAAGYDIFNAKNPPAERTTLAKAAWDTLAIPQEARSMA